MDTDLSHAKTPSPEDFAQIFGLLGGYRVSQALYVAVELGIPDLLLSGPKHCDELAAKTKTHGPTLYRLLRFLAGAGLCNETGSREFELTPLGSALRSDIPGSISPVVRLWLSESHWLSWGHLLHSVRTGEHAFDHAHGMRVFDYLRNDSELSAIFNATMTTSSTRLGSALLKHYDFSGIRKIVDVGGGHGFTLAMILAANPSMHGLLYDLPDVASGAGQIIDAEGVRERCEIVGGSFFDSIPAGAEAYVLKQIIHDWDDEQSLMILRNCRAAMPKEGKVLLIERRIEPDHCQAMRVLHIDMEMLVNVCGMERNDAEYRSLLERAGFRLVRVLPLMDGAGFAVFEAVPSD
jgi:O-methyltransferase domain/Dimerisation domain